MEFFSINKIYELIKEELKEELLRDESLVDNINRFAIEVGGKPVFVEKNEEVVLADEKYFDYIIKQLIIHAIKNRIHYDWIPPAYDEFTVAEEAVGEELLTYMEDQDESGYFEGLAITKSGKWYYVYNEDNKIYSYKVESEEDIARFYVWAIKNHLLYEV